MMNNTGIPYLITTSFKFGFLFELFFFIFIYDIPSFFFYFYSSLMKYRHLFFDLDHTLWDFEANAKETLYELYLRYDLAKRGIYNFDSFFNKYSYHNNRLWDRYTKGFIKQEELRWKRMWLAMLEYKLADEA